MKLIDYFAFVSLPDFIASFEKKNSKHIDSGESIFKSHRQLHHRCNYAVHGDW